MLADRSKRKKIESARRRSNTHVSRQIVLSQGGYVTSTKVTVCDDQYDKLKNAIAHQKPNSIKLNLDHSGGGGGGSGGGGGGGGEHTLLLTRGQIAKIDRSRLIRKRKVTIPLSKRQVKANVQHQGGFLAMLGGFAAKALPSILGGLATGLV